MQKLNLEMFEHRIDEFGEVYYLVTTKADTLFIFRTLEDNPDTWQAEFVFRNDGRYPIRDCEGEKFTRAEELIPMVEEYACRYICGRQFFQTLNLWPVGKRSSIIEG